MSALVLERRLSHKRAQARRSHWIRVQKAWDKILKRKIGMEVYPPPHEVFRVERQGHHYAVVFDDPTL